MAEFEIKVQELDAGGKQYVLPLRAEWLDRALAGRAEGDLPLRGDRGAGEGEVSVYAEKSGDDVLVRGRVRGRLLTECSRCLGDAPVPVDAELVALYTARGGGVRRPPDEDELSPEEIDKEFYSGETVVLDELVRENVLLEVPMQPLCRADCAGLEVPESVRGPKDLATADTPEHQGKKVDPRLAPLLSLMNTGATRAPVATNERPPASKNAKKKGR